MTIFADRRQEGALATIGYDDDGAPAAFADFNIVEKGVFKNFQMAIGQAHYLGLAHDERLRLCRRSLRLSVAAHAEYFAETQ